MPRNLDSNLSAHLGDGVIQPAFFLSLEFRTGVVNAWTGVGPITWGGLTFQGVGNFGRISPISEGSEVQADGVTVQLWNLPLIDAAGALSTGGSGNAGPGGSPVYCLNYSWVDHWGSPWNGPGSTFITGQGGTPPYTYQIVSGAVPTGCFNAWPTGVTPASDFATSGNFGGSISTSSTPGVYIVWATATDSLGAVSAPAPLVFMASATEPTRNDLYPDTYSDRYPTPPDTLPTATYGQPWTLQITNGSTTANATLFYLALTATGVTNLPPGWTTTYLGLQPWNTDGLNGNYETFEISGTLPDTDVDAANYELTNGDGILVYAYSADQTNWYEMAYSVTLQGTPGTGTAVDTVSTDIQLGAPAKLWFGLLKDGVLLGTPYLIFSGMVDQPTMEVDTQTMTLTLALENRLTNLQRPNCRRYTSADQRLYYPDDSAFDHVEELNDVALVWG